MSSVIYYCAVTLDGYIAESDDTIDWLTGYQGSYDGEAPPVEGGYEDFYEEVGALVSGSVTYEWILGHMSRGGSWPYAGKPCWVLSSRDLSTPDAEGADVRIVRGEVADLFEEMLASAGDRNLWVLGGGNVASQFADADLLDEMLVTVVPVVLGAGKPVFERPLAKPMQLIGANTHATGMVYLRYEVRRGG